VKPKDLQLEKGKWEPIIFFSKKLTSILSYLLQSSSILPNSNFHSHNKTIELRDNARPKSTEARISQRKTLKLRKLNFSSRAEVPLSRAKVPKWQISASESKKQNCTTQSNKV
jgi:hypothetical protein